MAITFYILAGIAIISALMVVSVKNLVHAVLSLALMLLSVAGLYLLLNAEFLALVQVLIYIGAIVVLFIFLIMLTARISDSQLKQTNHQRAISFIASGMLLVLLIVVLTKTTWQLTSQIEADNTIPRIGELLLTTYVLPFELVSVLLLGALIGAIVIARREEIPFPQQKEGQGEGE